MQTDLITDYNELIKYVIKNGLLKKNRPEISKKLRTVHKYVYSLAIWEYELSRIYPNQDANIFLGEIRSDAINSILLSLYGFKKSANLSIRGIIENTFRYVYYYDHPIELALMNGREKYFISIKEFSDWLVSHPNLKEKISHYQINDKLYEKYGKTSEIVHGTRPRYLQLVSSLNEIKFYLSDFNAYIDTLREVVRDSNFVISVFHKRILGKLDYHNKMLIMQTLPDSRRDLLSKP